MAKKKHPADQQQKQTSSKQGSSKQESHNKKSDKKNSETLRATHEPDSLPLKKNRKRSKDPHAKREADKYQHPIASREFILQLIQKQGKPVSFTELLNLLSFSSSDEEAFEALKRRVKAMLRDGQLLQNRRGAYGLPQKMDLIKGRVSATSGGFGFLIPEDGGDDLFLSSGQMQALFDGDIILAKISGIDRRGRKEGRVEEILERHTHELVGRCYRESGVLFLKPDSKKITRDIVLVESDTKLVGGGEFVVAEIVRQPDYHSPALAKVTEVLGAHMAPGMEIDVAIRAHQLPHIWSDSILKMIEAIPSEITRKEINARIDLRDKAFVTIDGEDARDFDDAVLCEKTAKGWNLFVAIADVAHYVKSGSELDEEAYARGNSVYFPQRVIPMLPEKLSNGLCSLNPHEDRLTLVCEMHLDKAGELQSYRFMEACIHSKARLTYTQVARFLEDGSASENLLPVVEEIVQFHELYRCLKVKRDKRGAINVESTETRFIFDENRKIESVVPVVRNVAHQMIEEAMLLANICAARLLSGKELPALYRVHDEPSAEKMLDLKNYLQPLGFNFSAGENVQPRHFQEVLRFAEGRADQALINTIVLRSMQQAIYSENCSQHFGLAYEQYAHFTSPIRRYPDLIVHRALKYFIRNNPDSSLVRAAKQAQSVDAKHWLVSDKAVLREKGQHLSFTERRADLAVRDATDWLKCEFMLDKVGEVFNGKISSITGFGLFVVLDDIYVEGLVHISDLKNDYYHFDERRHELKAEHSGEVFRLADEVCIQVARVDLDEKKIEFMLHGQEHERKFSGSAGKKKSESKKGKSKGKNVKGAKSKTESFGGSREKNPSKKARKKPKTKRSL